MKKSIFLVMGLCILCVSVMFLSCDNDTSTNGKNDNDTQPSELVGRWDYTDGEMSMMVTTNSNQTAVDFMSPGTGGLNLSGVLAGSLTYMMMMEDGGETMAVAANVSLTEFFNMVGFKAREKMKNPRSLMSELKAQLTYPVYVLYVASNQGAQLMAATSQSDTTTYFGTADGLTFDIPNFKLTANNLTLYDATIYPPATLLVNGTLQNQVTNVPANTPTNVMTIPLPNEVEQTVVLSENGDFMAIATYDSESDTSYGTWAVTGKNTLTIVDYEEADTTTTVATYAVNGNNLDITMDEDACDEDTPEDVQDCLNDIGAEFGMDENSLVSATTLIVMSFTKADATKL